MSLYRDATMRARIHALFDVVWPRLSDRLALAAGVGADWHEVSVPFVAFEEDVAVAHVGVIEIPLVIAGVPTVVAGVHAVCTHPDHRGRGHSRRLLREALAYADTRSDTAQLTTELPRVFRSAGFREVSQTRFVVEVPRAQQGTALRRLSAEQPDDVALLHRLLAARTPISHRLGVVEPGWLLLIDEVLASYGFLRLYHAADLDVVVALEVRDEVLVVYDVVAAALPALSDIVARVTEPFSRVELCFTPDRFDVSVVGQSDAYPGDALMVRGPYAVEGGAFAVPLLAHC